MPGAGGNPCEKTVLEQAGFEDLQPWFRAYKYMLKTGRSRDIWHDPKYAELLAVQQEGFRAYLTGETADPKQALDSIASRQQELLFEAGRSTVPPRLHGPRKSQNSEEWV